MTGDGCCWIITINSSPSELPRNGIVKNCYQDSFIVVHHLNDPSAKVKLPLHPAPAATVTVKVWDDDCEAQYAESSINEWFSLKLGFPCKAVYMPESSERKLDLRYAISNKDITAFADGYPC